MSLISGASIVSILRHCAGVLLPGIAILLVASTAAVAVDGNYVSPYASQYATRSTAAAIPNVTWVGMLLVLVTVVAALYYALRHRIRQRGAA